MVYPELQGIEKSPIYGLLPANFVFYKGMVVLAVCE